MGHYCKVCDKQISEARVKLGYSETCTTHSNTFRYVSFVAGSNKSDYEISIVRDKETAEHMQHLLQTRGVL